VQEDEGIEGVALAEGPRFVSALFVDPVDERHGSRIEERDRDRIVDRQQVIVCFWIDGERMSQGMVGCRWWKHVRHGSRRKSEERWMGISEVDGRCGAVRWETAEHLAKLRECGLLGFLCSLLAHWIPGVTSAHARSLRK